MTVRGKANIRKLIRVCLTGGGAVALTAGVFAGSTSGFHDPAELGQSECTPGTISHSASGAGTPVQVPPVQVPPV